jgi:hypothetical protein
MTKFTRKVKTGGFSEFTFHYIGRVGGGLIYVIVIKWFLWLNGKSKTASDYHIMIDMAQVSS